MSILAEPGGTVKEKLPLLSIVTQLRIPGGFQASDQCWSDACFYRKFPGPGRFWILKLYIYPIYNHVRQGIHY